MRIKATDEKGEKTEFAAYLTASVRNFTLPVTPASRTAFGLNKGCLDSVYCAADNPGLSRKIYKNYYDCLLEHGISAYNLPYDILSPEADIERAINK